MGVKKCCTCKQSLPLDQFYKNKAHKDGLQNDCKPCRMIQVRKWQANNKGRVREIKKLSARRNKATRRTYVLKTIYKISKEKYQDLLEDQNNRCPICEVVLPSNPHVDHCHITGRVRGILCGSCNRGLGMLKDSPFILDRAKQYLERWI